jgi:hypothetical protein
MELRNNLILHTTVIKYKNTGNYPDWRTAKIGNGSHEFRHWSSGL